MERTRIACCLSVCGIIAAQGWRTRTQAVRLLRQHAACGKGQAFHLLRSPTPSVVDPQALIEVPKLATVPVLRDIVTAPAVRQILEAVIPGAWGGWWW